MLPAETSPQLRQAAAEKARRRVAEQRAGERKASRDRANAQGAAPKDRDANQRQPRVSRSSETPTLKYAVVLGFTEVC